MRKLTEVEEGHGNANIYVDASSKASIVAIDTKFFEKIAQEDKQFYYPKVWKKVASRVLTLSKYELGKDDIFKNLSEEALKFICAMCEVKIYGDESVDMSLGGIVLNGRAFLPEEGPHSDPGPVLRYIAPGSGTYKYVEMPGAAKSVVIMHFPDSDVMDMSTKILDEDQVREAYKKVQLARFKQNCREAFKKRVE